LEYFLNPLGSVTQFVVPALAGLALGGLAGRALARRGVQAATALGGRKRQVMAWVAVLAMAVLALGFYFGAIQDLVAPEAGPYVELLLHPLASFLAAGVLLLIVTLEGPGISDPARRRPLISGSAVSTFLLVYLGWLSLPVYPEEDVSANGVVYQTTSHTCAAASIATVARLTGAAPTLTEAEAAALAGTTVGGTLSLGEVRALSSLGLEARFGRRLTVDSLLAHGGPAVLHVREPLPGGRRIRHAVALLAIDEETRTVRVGNPLEGEQTYRFSQLDGYWLGEAVLVAVR
jgi:hypothetical protein